MAVKPLTRGECQDLPSALSPFRVRFPIESYCPSLHYQRPNDGIGYSSLCFGQKPYTSTTKSNVWGSHFGTGGNFHSHEPRYHCSRSS